MRTCVITIYFTSHYKRVSRVTTTGVIQGREEQAGDEAAGNIRTEEMNTGIEGEGEGRT